MNTLVAIGGALDLRTPGSALQAFYDRSGGSQARIVILNTASASPQAGEETRLALNRLGLHQPAIVLPVQRRDQAADPVIRTAVQTATGIFFTGGAQLRITTTLGGTPLLSDLHTAFQRGAVIAGTSAGAAALSSIMFAYGKGGPTPRLGLAHFASGLGFTDRLVFDQHFRQRDRLGRLILCLAQHPGLLGVGIDENTAAILETAPGGAAWISVTGANAVTIVDASQAGYTTVAELSSGQPIAISNLQLHILTADCRFDLNRRLAEIPEQRQEVD